MKKFFSKVWEYIKTARVELIVFAALLVVDLVTKAVVDATMSVGQSVVVIPKFFDIYYTRNPGIAFGMFSDMGAKVVLLIVTGAAIIFFSIYLYRIRGKHIVGRIGLALLISGAFGNFIDRLIFGYVRDFLQIIYFGLNLPVLGSSFAVFNIADVGVTVGVVMFLVYIIFLSDLTKGKDEEKGKKEKEREKSEVILLDGEEEVALNGENGSDGTSADFPSADGLGASDGSAPVEARNNSDTEVE